MTAFYMMMIQDQNQGQECTTTIMQENEYNGKECSANMLDYPSTSMLEEHGITANLVHFINNVLPRLVASALTMYIGICLGYVGLVHLTWISPN